MVSQPMKKFLNGTLPTITPAQALGYEVVEAFPNLESRNPLVFTPEPGTNRIIIGSRHGVYEAFDNNPFVTTSEKQPFLDITARTAVVWDGGNLGMTFHPEFETNPGKRFIYVWYCARVEGSSTKQFWGTTESVNLSDDVFLRLSRFTVVDDANGDYADPSSEFIMINIHLLSYTHRGGGMAWDDDGNLIITIGDQNFSSSSQDITNTLQGGWIRIDVDERTGMSHKPLRIVQDDPTYNAGTTIDGFAGHYAGSEPASQADMSNPTFLANPDKEFTGRGYLIPDDNPNWSTLAAQKGQTLNAGDYFEEYTAIGNRNPHRMTSDRVNGRFWSGEVGKFTKEEINVMELDEVSVGLNFGWPAKEGNEGTYDPNYIGVQRDPATDFHHDNAQDPEGGSNAIIGGYAYRGTDLPDFIGKYICGGYAQKRIFVVSHDEDMNGHVTNVSREVIATFNEGSLITFGEDHAGELYLCRQGGDNSKIYKIVPILNAPTAPTLLSSIDVFQTNQMTGDFTGISTLTPVTGLLPYELNVPFWSDGALKFRYIAVPNDEDGNGIHDKTDEKIVFSENGDWEFPVGTVFVKHFELQLDENNPSLTKRLETRFVVHGENGVYYFISYKWNSGDTDATLSDSGSTDNFSIALSGGGTRQQEWIYPSRTECLQCHSPEAASVLGAKTRQLNRDVDYTSVGGTVGNQLETYLDLDMFAGQPFQVADITNFATLSPLDGTDPIQDRARSYLDANCSYCHRPGTGNRSAFDARFSTPFEYQNFINAPLNEELGDPNNRVVIPQNLANSMVHIRISATTASGNQMPPLARNEIDVQGVNIIANWINALPVTQAGTAQTVTFPAITDKCTGDPDFALGATASSGLPVSYFVEQGEGYVDVTGGVVSIDLANIALGLPLPATVTVVARQPGDATYDPAQAAQTFTISEAASNLDFVTNGAANEDPCNDCITVTPDLSAMAGTAWSDFKLNLNESFRLTLEVNLGMNDQMGGDGMTFALHDDPAGTAFIGSIGSVMAVNGLSPSFGVEFDTYQSNGAFDPAEDHIAFWSNGDVTMPLQPAVQASNSSTNIEDSGNHDVVIEWNPSLNLVTVEFDGVIRDIYNGDIRQLFGVTPEAYFGFGGGTGGVSNEQVVCVKNLETNLSLFNISLTKDEPNCGMTNGTATVNASGGTAPYTYQWDANAGNQVTATATNLGPGMYYVTVSDAASVTKITSITLMTIPGPTLAGSSTPANCNASDGTATVTPTPSPGGSTAFTYQWDSNAGDQTTQTAVNLPTGAYSVTVSDGDLCMSMITVTVEQLDPFTVTFPTVVNASGCSTSDGSATVQTTPSGSYTYLWDDPLMQSTATATGLAAGSYMVTVMDANLCTVIETVEIGRDNCPVLDVVGATVYDGGTCYTLTPQATNQKGAAWAPTKIDLTENFILTTEISFGDSDAGADGLVFALQDDARGTAAIGDQGGSMGIDDQAGGDDVAPSFGVVFKTHPTASGDRVYVFEAGNTTTGAALVGPSCASGVSCANIEDGMSHTVVFNWNGTQEILNVFFDGELVIQYDGTTLGSVTGRLGVTQVYWGFAAATGGATNEHQVCISDFVTGNPNTQTIQFPAIDDICADEGSLQLNAMATSGLPVTYSIITGSDLVAFDAQDPTVLNLLGDAGLVTIEANQAGDGNFDSAPPVQQSFTIDPAVGVPFVAYGDATEDLTDCNCYTVTPDVTLQAGTVWSQDMLDLSFAFSFEADFMMSEDLSADNRGRADGITFALQNVSSSFVGSSGKMMAVDGLTYSFGVEFDTHASAADVYDVNTNPGGHELLEDHVAFWAGGDLTNPLAGPVLVDQATPNFEDGQYHRIKVDWDPVTQTMTVSFDGTMVLSYTSPGDLVTDFLNGDPNVYFGFGGGTGGKTSLQKFCVVNLVKYRDATIEIQAFLQGPYNSSLTEMNDNLLALMPLTDPYGLGETVISIPTDAVDWIKVELRDPDDNSQVVASRACFIKKNGEIIDLDGSPGVTFSNISIDKAYITVMHRNHLGMMTSTKISLD